MKILIVDDESAISTLLEYNLRKKDYETFVASDGKEAFEQYKRNKFDLLIIDLMLPKIDGITLIKKIRERNDDVLILILSAKGTKKDIVKGLNSGADDYVIKPFSPEEIVARVAALLRRHNSDVKKNTKFEIFGNILTLPSRKEVELTKKELELFKYLHKNKNQILSREQIIENVWPFDNNSGRVVDIQVSHLREKIEFNPKKPIFLKTIRGFGYKLEEGNEE
ncbi:response regulator transcription factor [Companilactobacillus sp. DQM5]|uniref:response regulator transcription factor n=1 Tax=Companilactobacillus sp. DQM5 TaxID=3463359 RepID=UPI004059D8E3